MAKTAGRHETMNAWSAASIVWFEFPADHVERAKKFHNSLFGWKFEKLPAAVNDY
jgi:hypothetical protein